MPRYNSWYLSFALGLVTLSLVLYMFHYFIFRDSHHILSGLLEEIAFVPIHVLLITLIIDRLLNERDKRATYSKLNMVVSTFFSELGTPLLKILPSFDQQPDKLCNELLIDARWSDKHFYRVRQLVHRGDLRMESTKGDLHELRTLLMSQKDLLLRLLENPSLTEYETFTDLMLAVFHLCDELSLRDNLDKLPQADYEHLSQDIRRVYIRLIGEWLRHMNHLQRDYPYLFSLAVRVNPFDPNSSPIVK